MSTTEPIKDKQELKKFKTYYGRVHPDSRNALFITIGLNMALCIGDILELRWKDVYDFEKGKKFFKIFQNAINYFHEHPI